MVRRMVLACAHDRPREPCRDEKEPTRIARRGGRHAEPALAAQRAARRPRTPPQVPARRGLPRVPRSPRVGGACDAAAVRPHQHRVRDRHHVQLGPAVWAGGVVAQIYVFLIWLEGRAAQKDRSARGIRVAVPSGVLAHLKYSRALPAWILVALCVAAPLAIAAGHAPLLALLLVALAILAPVLFKKFDS